MQQKKSNKDGKLVERKKEGLKSLKSNYLKLNHYKLLAPVLSLLRKAKPVLRIFWELDQYQYPENTDSKRSIQNTYLGDQYVKSGVLILRMPLSILRRLY